MEVQRMTLSTLKSMNLPLTDLRDALKIGKPAAEVAAPAEATPKSHSAAKKAGKKATKAAPPAPPPPAVDPMQWWGALTQQFTELASKAVKDSATDAAKNLAGAAVKQSISTAGKVLSAATRPRAAKR
jgi:hypothetical protein